MLSIIIIWFYILAICLIYGYGSAALLRIILKGADYDRLPCSLIIILGLCLISAIAGYLSLFIKIGLTANIIIIFGALIITAVYYHELTNLVRLGFQRLFAINKCILLLYLLSCIYILIKSTETPSSFDTGLYHAQAIRWIEEYPVVPGLGNLHARLAFNSAWFLPNALFGFSFLQLQPCHAVNGLFLSVIVFISLTGLHNLSKGQGNFSNILRSCICIPAIFVFKDNLSSPTPDIPAALLICLTFIYYLQLQEKDAEIPPEFLSLYLVILAAMAITIKLSALPLGFFLVALVSREIAGRRPANVLVMVGAALFLLLSFVLRNIWLSGYLAYPLPGLDLFNFDWQIPAPEVRTMTQIIKDFARDPQGAAVLLPVKGAFYWLPTWWRQTLADYGTKLEKIFLPVLLIMLSCLVQMIRTKCYKIDLQEIGKDKVIYLTAFAGLAFWFLTAPDLRFGLGFIIVAPIIIFMPFLKAGDYQVSAWFPWALGLLLLYFLVVFGAKDIRAVGPRLWLPAPYPQEPLAIKEIQGRKVSFPLENVMKCWYAPLPCAGYPGKFAFRGATLQDGFKAR